MWSLKICRSSTEVVDLMDVPGASIASVRANRRPAKKAARRVSPEKKAGATKRPAAIERDARGSKPKAPPRGRAL
ncbi:MAG: hypothetical protein ACYDES_02920 [Acidimicrobiales bacterium]